MANRHILVADDEPDTAELLALILAFRGFDVTRALDGAETLRLARELVPDLVLIDEQMPGLRGTDVCRALKNDPVCASCVVVLFSSSDEVDVDWQAAGAAAFLQKPINIRALPGFLDRMLENRPDPFDPADRTAAA